ncbi:MAG: hypothetical protein KIA66_06185 [Veillonella sp.]|nr:hypothetical protein [Veillonella sp.]
MYRISGCIDFFHELCTNNHLKKLGFIRLFKLS